MPTDSAAAVDPKAGDGEDTTDANFAVGEDESPGAEESREWNEVHAPEVILQPKYGVGEEDLENVWNGGEPSRPPKENP